MTQINVHVQSHGDLSKMENLMVAFFKNIII